MEVRKEKAETKIERQLAFNKQDTATEVQTDYPSLSSTIGVVFTSQKSGSLILSDVLMCSAGDGVKRASGRPGGRE